MKLIKHILLALTAIIATTAISAQGDVNSPFSRFGIGDLEDRGFMHTRLMGGIGTSYADRHHLNFDNPASFSHLKAAAFDVGITANFATISDSENSSRQNSGNLSYFALGFPLRNPLNEAFSREQYDFNLGMAFAVKPASTVSYNITTRDNLEGIGDFDRNFSGSGGFYEVLWGNSMRYKNLSFGVNLGYTFGTVAYERNIDFVDEINAFDNQFANSYNGKGFIYDFGLLFTHTFNKQKLLDNPGLVEPNILTVGLTAKTKTSFTTTSEIRNVNFTQTSVISGGLDTLFIGSGIKGNGSLPSELGFGLNYNFGNKILIGIDYHKTFWSSYKNDANPETLEDTYRVGFGGYYRPNYKSQNNFLARVYYRLGAYYEQDPRSIANERIKSYGLTIGLGLPFIWQRKFSNMNIGVNIGKRQVAGILEESFAKVSFGFTFNDTEWFLKRKFN